LNLKDAGLRYCSLLTNTLPSLLSSQTVASGRVTRLAKKEVRDLGMPLLSVIRVESGQADASDVKQ
jgi:hypothetical protein